VKKEVAIIGAGFSGLSAACSLAKEGYNVTIFEKNKELGGRARSIDIEGFHFDMGPTWYWMPDVFESFFNKFGKKVSDYYSLERLDPGYGIYFGEDDYLEIPESFSELKSIFEDLEPGSARKLDKFIKC